MKTIGLIGGMSWESSLEYYRIINKTVRERFGGLRSAKCILYSVDFADIEQLQHAGRWKQLTKLMIEIAQKLEEAGVDCVVICTNTMHKMADNIQEAIGVPVLHIADATGKKIIEKNIKTVGLLGTKFTMGEDFYKERLQEKYGIEVIIPDEIEREVIENVIYKELCCGITKESSKEKIRKIMKHLIKRGAKGIVLGCTELPLLIKQNDVKVPVFDTTAIHAKAAVDFATGSTIRPL